MSPGRVLVPPPAAILAIVLSSSFLPRARVLRNWFSSSLMMSTMVSGSFRTSGKVSPRLSTTTGTREEKKPGLAFSFSVA